MLPSNHLDFLGAAFEKYYAPMCAVGLCALGLESHGAPVRVATTTPQKNHTILCAEIQQELSADKKTYQGYFSRPQNTSEELCYGKFTKNFTSTLKELSDRYEKQDPHITKVYKNMKLLTQICPKLQPSEPPEECTIEQSDFSKFKEALERVIISIEGWKSCQKIKGKLWGSIISWG